MASVLDDLYFGRIHPCERNSSPEEQQLTGELAEHYEWLLETMTEEQRKHFEKFKDSLQEIEMIAERDIANTAHQEPDARQNRASAPLK